MQQNQFEDIKKDVQKVIDLIAEKHYQEAIQKLSDAGDLLDELLDHSADDDDLIEISRYQVLLNQLQQKIHNASM